MNYRLRKYLGFTLLTLAVYVTLCGGAYAEEAPLWFKALFCVAGREACGGDPYADRPPLELPRVLYTTPDPAQPNCPGGAYYDMRGDFQGCKPTATNHSANIRCVDRGGQLEWDAVMGAVVCR